MANRLAQESSPYLQQHRDNPVDWYPWGEEALGRARREDRPILLSVGYAACHWCHVMEKESFEDEATAEVMNEHFVNVKVDREERPDIDSIYMTAVQQMTGHGGWPMTVFLTPEGAPFYGGTYFPPEPRQGMPAFRQVLLAVSQAYRTRREDVTRSAADLTEMLRRTSSARLAGAELSEDVLEQATRGLLRRIDPRHGGFGSAPKFPQPMALEYLLRGTRGPLGGEALDAVRLTLDAMANGGIRDHLGGGFHRYSVDDRWLVPHFEKMLYDNALLSRAYLQAYLVTGAPEYLEVVEETLGWVLREMRSPEGGFYSTVDADSEGEEGRFYVWTPEEIDALLGEEEGRIFRAFYGVTPGGNFEGRNILNLPRPPGRVAADLGIPEEELQRIIRRSRGVLLEARARRVAPGLDDKVLTGWNGLMLRALCEAGFALDRPEYVEAARANAEFLLGTMRRDGTLLRAFRSGQARIDGFLEDYADLADGLLSLYDATFEGRWVEEARVLLEEALELFWSEAEGVFYDARTGGSELVVRPRDIYDNATPSGSSAAVTALLRLNALTGEDRYRIVSERALDSVGRALGEVPQGFGQWLCSLDRLLSPSREVVIVGPREDPGTRALLKELRTRYLPNTAVAGHDPAAGISDILEPLLAGKGLVDGEPAAYVCERFACRAPVTDPAGVAAALIEPDHP